MSTYNRALDRDERGRLKRHYRSPSWPWSTPGWWVRMYMNRWPLGNSKPHRYFW